MSPRFIRALLITGNKVFGISSNLRHLCAAIAPGKVEFLRWLEKGRALKPGVSGRGSVGRIPGGLWNGPRRGLHLGARH
jgi:hypothetical protein